MLAIKILLVVILIIFTAFFVATEFAIVRIRQSRVEQIVAEGAKRAKEIKKVTSNLDDYLSACQLGITITALGLGWLGEPTVERILHPLFETLNISDAMATTLSFVIAFTLITFLHVVLGELAPKTIAIQKAEFITALFARPIILFYKMMYPFIWLLNGAANQIIKALGFKTAKEHEEAHTEEELRLILSESYQSGEINQTEYGYVNRIFQFDELTAREVMVPRTDVVCLYIDRPFEENYKTIIQEQYTRFPVARKNKDKIIGMMNTKELFLHKEENGAVEFEALIRPVLSFPEATPIKQLLREMQQKHAHMVILLDEYGGTAGLLTIEDILEEIVGDIRDEFDAEEISEVVLINDQKVRVDGKLRIEELNKVLHTNIPKNEFRTVGGWLYSRNSMLTSGDEYIWNNLTFKVLEKEKHRIRKVEITKANE